MSFGIASSERDLAVQRLLAFQQTSNDSHVYECLSSSPECDSNLELRHGSGGGFRAACKRKSDSSAMGGESKVHHQPLFVRSVSLPYCGSETESELYAPYTFYTGDEVRHRFVVLHFVPIKRILLIETRANSGRRGGSGLEKHGRRAKDGPLEATPGAHYRPSKPRG